MTIFNKIRGLSPYPAAFTTFTDPAEEDHIIKIYRSRPGMEPSHLPPASIITDGKTKILVATSDGIIDILELQQAGKRKMLTEEFLRGFRINSDWKVG
jgi:methionyl-tRNA formyltransferase